MLIACLYELNLHVVRYLSWQTQTSLILCMKPYVHWTIQIAKCMIVCQPVTTLEVLYLVDVIHFQ